ncbi:uncharacterized protein V1516DRAFT_686973 [Lipomyces oligophaga]|uniref:uncharacterized protein n=1 Tax=Lipomyces oligophaga TaxID=45792 RepID=UPI0034CEDF52
MSTVAQEVITEPAISQAAEQAEDQTTTTAPSTTEESTSALKFESAVLAHLRGYPIVDATLSYTSSIPLVQRASETAKPYYEKFVIPAVNRAAPVLVRVDKLGDTTLTKVDKLIPALKTTQPPNITGTVSKSVSSVKSTTHLYTDAAKARVNSSIVEPTKNVVDKAKSRSSSFYIAKGRPFVHAKIDPVLSPLNSRLESFLNSHLPPAAEEAAATEDPAGTELGRLYLITTGAVYRVKPVVEDRITVTRQQGSETVAYLLNIPQSAADHVLAVYNDKLSKIDLSSRPVAGRIYLTLSTGKQLAFDVVDSVESFALHGVSQAKTLVKKPLSIVNGKHEPTANGAVATTVEPIADTQETVAN